MEKLSPEGKSSLLSSLSKLLGKKKELQDLELTVRTQGNGRRCRGTWRWGSWWGIPQTRQKMASGQRGRQWMPSPRLVKCPPPRLPGSPLHLVSLWRWANSADSQVPLIDRGWAAGQQNLLLEGGLTFPFQSPRLRDQGTQESNTFQDLIS